MIKEWDNRYDFAIAPNLKNFLGNIYPSWILVYSSKKSFYSIINSVLKSLPEKWIVNESFFTFYENKNREVVSCDTGKDILNVLKKYVSKQDLSFMIVLKISNIGIMVINISSEFTFIGFSEYKCKKSLLSDNFSKGCIASFNEFNKFYNELLKVLKPKRYIDKHPLVVTRKWLKEKHVLYDETGFILEPENYEKTRSIINFKTFLKRWEYLVSIYGNTSTYYTWEEYENDLHVRNWLQNLKNKIEVPKELQNKLKRADEKFCKSTVLLKNNYPLEYERFKKRYDEDEQWWFFRIPKGV